MLRTTVVAILTLMLWLRALVAGLLLGAVTGAVLLLAKIPSPHLTGNDAGTRSRFMREEYQGALANAISDGAFIGALGGLAVSIAVMLIARNRRGLAVAALVLATSACSPAPTAPTSSQQSSFRPPARTYTIDFRFDSTFWKALIYDAHDEPAGVRARLSWVHDLADLPDFFIRLGNSADTSSGCERLWNGSDVNFMRQVIRGVVQQVTGLPYNGRILSGCEDRHRQGWITIVLATTAENPELTGCGLARPGADPGRVWIRRDHLPCTSTRTVFGEVLAHEVGHAMGLFHVPDGNGHLMAVTEYTGGVDFSRKERDHAQLAYQRGRHARYCDTVQDCSSD